MSVGSGVFWGLVVLSLVLLYRSTADRWRWRLLPKRLGIAALLVVGGGLVWAGGSYAIDTWDARPKRLTKLLGVQLGMSPDDVLYLKGEPVRKEDEAWFYGDDEWGWLQIGFEKDRVYVVMTSRCITFMGVESCEATQGELAERFGPPNSFTPSNDRLARLYRWEDWNVRALLARGEVAMIGISSEPLRFGGEKGEGG